MNTLTISKKPAPRTKPWLVRIEDESGRTVAVCDHSTTMMNNEQLSAFNSQSAEALVRAHNAMPDMVSAIRDALAHFPEPGKNTHLACAIHGLRNALAKAEAAL